MGHWYGQSMIKVGNIIATSHKQTKTREMFKQPGSRLNIKTVVWGKGTHMVKYELLPIV